MSDNENYISILRESLEKKIVILEDISKYTERQKQLLSESDFKVEEYNDLVEKKDKLADSIEILDIGFSRVYKLVSKELEYNKENHVEDIKELKRMVSTITEMVTSIQADEKRNFEKAKGMLTLKQKEVASARKSNTMAANYYKVMSKTTSEPQFMDKKN